jgi:dihydroorotase-like cyclic amidohydrolase
MATTLIRGGTVVNADLSERADVLIKDGRSWLWARGSRAIR